MYIIFKDKKSKRSHEAVGIKFFLTFLLGDRRIQEAKNMWIRNTAYVNRDEQSMFTMAGGNGGASTRRAAGPKSIVS
jgi:hypothetical protein